MLNFLFNLSILRVFASISSKPSSQQRAVEMVVVLPPTKAPEGGLAGVVGA